MTFYRCICIFPRDRLVDGYVFIQVKHEVFIGSVGDVVQCESETLSDEGICENQHKDNEEHRCKYGISDRWSITSIRTSTTILHYHFTFET